MAILQMQRVSICALKKDRKAILEKLQSMGVMEISQIMEDDEDFKRMDTMNVRQGFERSAQTAEHALDALSQYAPEKKSTFASLEGKKLVESGQFQKIVSKEKEIMRDAAALLDLNKEIAESRASVQKLENQIESLRPWMALDVPMNYAGTAKTAMLLGTMAPGTTMETVYKLIADHARKADGMDTPDADVQIVSSDKDAAYLCVVCMKKDERAVEDALRSGGFARPSQPADKVPAQAKADYEAEKEQLNRRIAEIIKEIEGKAGIREDLKAVSDYFRVRAGKYEVLGSLPQSQRTFLVSGYVAKRDVSSIEKAIGGRFDCIVDVDEPKAEEDPPVLLSNNGFSASMEGVLESYALPHRGEFDPTTIMSFFYVFFFGMMLSDAAYGAILAIACFAALQKFPRMGEGMKKTMRMFFYCGLSTLAWGILFGGYFGNVVDIVSSTFFGKTVHVPALWFEPLNDPMTLLVYSLGFGLVHLFVGLGIKGYMLVRDGKVLDCVCDVVLWYALLIGLILMLIPTDIFASILGSKVEFPAALNSLAKSLATVGALGLVLMSGRASKNPGLRIALGAYDLYNITGWLSDVLSYSRLLALGLATGVIASVINQMASMAGNSFVGAVIFILIFIVGHTLNLAINMLGAYVHTNRLQFVEFFGKFYEGGGRAFNPFGEDTVYVTVQKSNESN